MDQTTSDDKYSQQNQIYSKHFREKSISSKFIMTTLIALVLFLESIKTLLSIFSKGVVKKEILSEKSRLGFDLIIKKSKN